MNVEWVKDRWNELRPEQKRVAKAIGALIIIVVAANVFKRDKVQVKQREAKPEMSVVTAPRKEEGVPEMRTRIENMQSAVNKERAQRMALEETVRTLKEGSKEAESRQVQDLMREVGTLREEVKLTRSSMMDPNAKTDKVIGELPPPLDEPKKEVIEVKRPRIRIHGLDEDSESAVATQQRDVSPSGNKITVGSTTSTKDAQATATPGVLGDNAKGAAQVSQQKLQFLPLGTIFTGVLLSGADVPTSGQAQKNTVPVLMRVKQMAILPNRITQDLRECHIILSGYGVMSSGRAKFRTEGISCVRDDGGVIESKIDGYASDEDGKEGIKGNLVEKQGAILARGMIAGFLSGFGQLLTPSLGSSLMLNSSQQSFLSPNVGAAAEAGAARGVSQAASDYSKFFLEAAKEMHPVIEIPSGIPITVTLVRGVSLALGSNIGKRGDFTSMVKQSWATR